MTTYVVVDARVTVFYDRLFATITFSNRARRNVYDIVANEMRSVSAQMQPLTVELQPRVSGGILKDPVCLRQIIQIDGVVFWKANKCDAVVTRLLLGRAHQRERPLVKTNILETLSQLRNQRMLAILAGNHEAQDDLGLDGPEVQKIAQSDLTKLPAIIEVDAPSIGDVGGMTVKVLTCMQHQPLWLELSSSIVVYLQRACDHQLNHGDIMPSRFKDDKHATEDNGVSWEGRRKSFRARMKTGKTKYFNVSDYGCEELAREAAADWVGQDAVPIVNRDGDEPAPLVDAS